ncbi:MAG: hypothetical protein QXI22_09215 [Sulfolobales archaeon]
MSSWNFHSNALLALMVVLSAWILWSIGEPRVDAYIALYTIWYLIIKMLLKPKKLYKDPLLAVLLTVFAATVAYRVVEVLSP